MFTREEPLRDQPQAKALNVMERSQFEEHKMASVVGPLPSTIIKLDVGGRRFKTTIATLCREESMLSAMFSGKGFKVEKDEDGCFFIDRPGAPFEHILNYLQTGLFIPPTDPALLKAVQLEADFYQIELVEQARWLDFAFCDINDHRGVLYWLGTKEGTVPYWSPVDAGVVKVVSLYNGRNLIERASGDGGCCWALNRSFTIELPVAVRPDRYCLSYATASYCRRRPANWTLSASVDGGQAWVTLRAHVDDRALVSADRASWPIGVEQGEAFKHFRLTCTGASEGDLEDEDRCGEVEDLQRPLTCTGASEADTEDEDRCGEDEDLRRRPRNVDDQDYEPEPCQCFHVCGFELYGQVRLA